MYNNSFFPPSVNVGDIIKVFTPQFTEKHFEIVFVEPLPQCMALTKDFGSITSGSTSTGNKITQLEMEGGTKTDYSDFFHVRMFCIDDIQLTVKEPVTTSRFQTLNDDLYIDIFTHTELTELVIMEDNTITIDAKNPTQYTLPQSRVRFYGWRYTGKILQENTAKSMALSQRKEIKPLLAAGFSV